MKLRALILPLLLASALLAADSPFLPNQFGGMAGLGRSADQ